MNRLFLSGLVLIGVFLLSACSGVQTYPNRASAGDTVTIGLGWQKAFKRDNTTVRITPASGPVITMEPGNPALRALINFYPDPVSYLLVGRETDQDENFNYGATYGYMIDTYFTGGDKDIWQTAAFIDLPETLPLGDALIELENDVGVTASSTVLIVSGNGSPDQFDAKHNGPLTSLQLSSLERSPHAEISFSGVSIPYAIEVSISHSPDSEHGGNGKAYVVNPRGDIKNVHWSSTGSTLKVHIIPTRLSVLDNFKDFKFYLAGGVENPVINEVKAYDIDGYPVQGVIGLLE